MSSVAKISNSDQNPFFQTWDLPFGWPPFDKIELEHVEPALMRGIDEFRQNVSSVADSAQAPTFENTIEALELAANLFMKVGGVFGTMASTNSSEKTQAIEARVYPLWSEAYDDMIMNQALYEKINALNDERDALGLDQAQMRLLTKYYDDFVANGAKLAGDAKARLKVINAELAMLSAEFNKRASYATKAFSLHVTSKSELAGLSAGMMNTARAKAQDKGFSDGWVFTLDRSCFEPFMQTAEHREHRKTLFEGYTRRSTDKSDAKSYTEDLVLKTVKYRAERAELLGFKHHADSVLAHQMAQNAATVMTFLEDFWADAKALAKQECDQLQAYIDKHLGGFELQPWDWWYVAAKVREQTFAIDQNELKPYFELNRVRQAVFDTARKLFGVSFKVLDDLPTHHESVDVYEVLDADQSHLGVFCIDLFTRDSKRSGAWMSEFRGASNIEENTRPFVINVLNLIESSDGSPVLLSLNEVRTLFHEFGHACHGLLTQAKYPSQAGTEVLHDFVEMPSQVLENWGEHPEVMATYARHIDTGEPLSKAWLKRLEAARSFNCGFEKTEYIAASLLDMAWHTLSANEAHAVDDVSVFEKTVAERFAFMHEIVPRYRSTYFAHIFTGGYHANFYSYLWAEVLDADGFAAFTETGDVFNKPLAKKLRTHIYETGDTVHPMEAYKAFRGKAPDATALKRKLGFIQ